jgi:outer membrane protein assembly factor BamB
MKSSVGAFVALLGSGLAIGRPIHGADWSGWRGPNGCGVSSEKGLPERWSEAEGIRWKAPLPGRGVSGPIVASGRVFVTASSGVAQDRMHVLCFDASSGRQRWERQLWATGLTACHPKTSMAAPTPVADGERVYALFATFDVAAFDLDGTLVWYRSLAHDYPALGNQVGMAASPALSKDLVILVLDTDADAFVLALDRRTGENRWKTPRERGINWVSPLVSASGGGDELIVQGPGGLATYDLKTGRPAWSHKEDLDAIASPVTADGIVFAPGNGIVAVRPGPAGAAAEVLWKSNKLRTSMASPIVYEGRCYAVSSAGVLTCAGAADGAMLWQERLAGPVSASPVAADGKIYCVNEEGTTTVIRTNAEPRVIATNALGEPMLASPAIADGALFLRGDHHLFRIGN